ncbi:MAG TPA: pyridoxamine 5'-phosphate oxidase [Gemmatimonadaceae bacterium]|nr:pyridoxamine 5'-phosphate oxidase [Gemmatimonadaceae bacterium]
MAIQDLRRDYANASLSERDVLPDPIAQFAKWFDDAQRAEVLEPNAMALATVGVGGQPSARIVLLKGFDANGFVFFTDYRSRKSDELNSNARAGLCFWWGELERQVRITGTVAIVSREESEKYFHSRPRGSQIGAWSSHQSSVLATRDTLEQKVAENTARFGKGDIPLPEHWGGYRVSPTEIEFWQGRPSRLHDRIQYLRDGKTWRIARLSP